MDCIATYNSSYWMTLIVALLSLVVVVASLFLCYYLFVSATDSSAIRDSKMKTWVVVTTVAAIFGMLLAVYGFTRINTLSSCVNSNTSTTTTVFA